MDTLLYQQIEELISPIIAILVFTLIGVYGLILYFFFTRCFSNDEAKKVESKKEDVKNDDSLRDEISSCIAGYRNALTMINSHRMHTQSCVERIDDDIYDLECSINKLDRKLDLLDEKNVQCINDVVDDLSYKLKDVNVAMFELDKRLDAIELNIYQNNEKEG